MEKEVSYVLTARYPDIDVEYTGRTFYVNMDQNLNFHLLPLFISYRSGGEKLRKYQANSSCVIMSIILITTLFYKALILQGEIWFLGLKGLIPYFPHYLPAAVHALDPNLPQNSRTWKWDKCTTVGEENRIM